jgi:hypothetical protein
MTGANISAQSAATGRVRVVAADRRRAPRSVDGSTGSGWGCEGEEPPVVPLLT